MIDIVPITMNNLVVVSSKLSKYQAFYRDFDKAFDFAVLIN